MVSKNLVKFDSINMLSKTESSVLSMGKKRDEERDGSILKEL